MSSPARTIPIQAGEKARLPKNMCDNHQPMVHVMLRSPDAIGTTKHLGRGFPCRPIPMDSGFAESILGRHHIGPQDRLVKARTPWTPPAPSQTAGESVPPPLVRGELEGGHCLQRAAGQLRTLAGDCRGALLLETVIAIMVFSLVGVAVLGGLSTAYTSGAKTEVQSVAENLARNQVESIFSGPYREPDQTPIPP